MAKKDPRKMTFQYTCLVTKHSLLIITTKNGGLFAFMVAELALWGFMMVFAA